MNTLQEWKKAKREEFEKIVFEVSGTPSFCTIEDVEKSALNYSEKTKAFLDTSFDELIALVEAEVVPEEAHLSGKAFCGHQYNEHGGFNECREKVLQAFSRLRGETNN